MAGQVYFPYNINLSYDVHFLSQNCCRKGKNQTPFLTKQSEVKMFIKKACISTQKTYGTNRHMTHKKKITKSKNGEISERSMIFLTLKHKLMYFHSWKSPIINITVLFELTRSKQFPFYFLKTNHTWNYVACNKNSVMFQKKKNEKYYLF